MFEKTVKSISLALDGSCCSYIGWIGSETCIGCRVLEEVCRGTLGAADKGTSVDVTAGLAESPAGISSTGASEDAFTGEAIGKVAYTSSLTGPLVSPTTLIEGKIESNTC